MKRDSKRNETSKPLNEGKREKREGYCCSHTWPIGHKQPPSIPLGAPVAPVADKLLPPQPVTGEPQCK